MLLETFEDAKGASRTRKLKDRQHNGQNKNGIRHTRIQKLLSKRTKRQTKICEILHRKLTIELNDPLRPRVNSGRGKHSCSSKGMHIAVDK